MGGRCDMCVHWKPTEYGWGKCSEVRTKLEIDLITGYEGAVVNYIETESDFGCTLFEHIDEHKD
jgi:hypothetical protein